MGIRAISVKRRARNGLTCVYKGSSGWECSRFINARPVEDSDPITHFVIVRRDLPPGVLAAQLVHAAGESSNGDLAEGTFAVVLAVADQAALSAERARLSLAGVAHVAIHEPDAPYDGALMAIGLRPGPRSQLRRHVAQLPLFRGSTSESANCKPSAQAGNAGSSPASGTMRS